MEPRVSSGKARSTPKRASTPGKAATSKAPLKRGTKVKPGVSRAKPVTLLAGGNPQIAKGDGDAPVHAYLAAMPGWKRDVGRRVDALIVRNVPNVRKAVKWNSPLYGIDGQGWFLGVHVFTRSVKLAFFRGTSLRPVPPGGSQSKDTRYLDLREGDAVDDAQLASWVKQAAALPGWVPSPQARSADRAPRARGPVRR